MMAITTPKGYIDIYYFSYMPVIIGIFAAIVGAGLLVGDEEKGILDLVLAHPVSRTALFWGRLLGFVAATVVILLVGWLSWVIPSGSTGLDLTWIEFLRPFLPLFAVLILFGMSGAALEHAAALGACRRHGLRRAPGGQLSPRWAGQHQRGSQGDIEFTPLHYYQGGDAITELNWGWLAGLLAVAVVFGPAGLVAFPAAGHPRGRRGGWRLPSLRARGKEATDKRHKRA